MKALKNTLSKSERVTSRIIISDVYKKGKHINEFPVKLVWHKNENSKPGIDVVFSVPKRKFKRAVDRNKIKRIFREVYRKHKHQCLQESINQNISVSMFLVYLGKEIPEYKTVESKIILLLNRLLKEINSNK